MVLPIKELNLTKEITENIILTSIELVNNHYTIGYHKQNPHLLSSVIQLQKAVFIEIHKSK